MNNFPRAFVLSMDVPLVLWDVSPFVMLMMLMLFGSNCCIDIWVCVVGKEMYCLSGCEAQCSSVRGNLA